MSTAAARAGGSAATPAVNQRVVDFKQQLDSHTRALVENYGRLLRSAKITNQQNAAREDLQINVATASLATAGEGLLRQIREVKLAVMLQDEEAMDTEVDQALAKIASEREELEKELEALSNDLKAAYAKAAMGGTNGEGGGGEPITENARAGAAAVDTSMDVTSEVGRGGERR
ncbi:unnamed protein product [Pylaiella littoralis]